MEEICYTTWPGFYPVRIVTSSINASNMHLETMTAVVESSSPLADMKMSAQSNAKEHSNRPLKGLMAPEVHIHDISIEVASQKHEFFRNTANNMQLIKTLSSKFQEVQINVRKSKGGCRHSHRKDCKELCRRPFRRKHRCIDDSSLSLERRQQRHLLL